MNLGINCSSFSGLVLVGLLASPRICVACLGALGCCSENTCIFQLSWLLLALGWDFCGPWGEWPWRCGKPVIGRSLWLLSCVRTLSSFSKHGFCFGPSQTLLLVRSLCCISPRRNKVLETSSQVLRLKTYSNRIKCGPLFFTDILFLWEPL